MPPPPPPPPTSLASIKTVHPMQGGCIAWTSLINIFIMNLCSLLLPLAQSEWYLIRPLFLTFFPHSARFSSWCSSLLISHVLAFIPHVLPQFRAFFTNHSLRFVLYLSGSSHSSRHSFILHAHPVSSTLFLHHSFVLLPFRLYFLSSTTFVSFPFLTMLVQCTF